MDKQKQDYQRPLVEVIEIEYEGVLLSEENEDIKATSDNISHVE